MPEEPTGARDGAAARHHPGRRRGGPGDAPALLAAAGLTLAAGVLVALLAAGREQSVADGLSWLGVNRRTVVPFALSALSAAVLLLLGARLLAPLPELTYTRLVLRSGAILLLGVVATPYTASPWLHGIHNSLGAALFALQLSWVAWLWLEHRSAAAGLAAAVMLATGLLALASLLGVLSMMLWAQLAYQAVYLGYLPVAVRRLVRAASARSGEAVAS